MDKRLIWLLGTALGIYIILTAYRQTIGPLIIGSLIAYILYPSVIKLKSKTKLSHSRAAGLVYIIFVLFLVAILVVSAPVLVRQINFFENEIDNIAEQVIGLEPVLFNTYGFNLPLNDIVASLEDEISQSLDPDQLFRVIRSATTNVVWVLVIFVSSFFLLKDWNLLKSWFYALFPESVREEVISIHDEIKLIWQSYLRGQLLMMLLIGGLSAIGGLAVGLKGAILMGLLAGGLALIPNIGPAIATLIAGAIAWFQGSSYIQVPNIWFAVIVVGIYVSIQFLEGIWFQPQIMSKRMHLHPGIIIIVVVATISLLGALAGLIIIPLIATIGYLIKYFFNRGRDKQHSTNLEE